MKKNLFVYLFFLSLFSGNTYAQKNVLHDNFKDNLEKDDITRSYVTPVKIIWLSDNENRQVKNPKVLLTKFDGQLSTSGAGMCVLKSDNEKEASVLLDFGKELYGGVQIAAAIRGEKKPIKIRVRMGESVSEAMSNYGEGVPGMNSATNDHSLRDFTLELPWLGTVEIGNSGFRFVRIDLLDKDIELPIRSVRAIARYRDIPYIGSFHSSDDRLNKIWETGAYTVHLNMQEYLWDGIKRDRLVWLGDLHPEVMTVNTVFGYNEVIPKSLDFARDITPLPNYMNGMPTYSLWWIIIHRDWYKYQGNLEYLKQQQEYLSGLLRYLFTKIDEDGNEHIGSRFLDWPASPNEQGLISGVKALMVLALEAGGEMCHILGDNELSAECASKVELMKKTVPAHNGLKQAAALLAMANMMPAKQANDEVIAVGGAKNFSTFYGYYMLQAQALAGDYEGAIENIKTYWGGMLDLGATTFWEDFNLDWMENAARIDELVPEGKVDVHAKYGDYCYVGLRHSFCHGWASGPTSWLTQHVLGVNVLEPGCKTVQIRPNLGNLEFAEGTFPTPFGEIYVKHSKQANGKIQSVIKAPKEVKIKR
ncbi:MAG: alpha-L-rhamnosidase [Dysgonamonadaceae bacterium]|jgi:hypothetical protein|nr:alpha-L-rhamnosidase [Dysgonamonadaceae bacterium]